MIKVLLFDFARVILLVDDIKYQGALGYLYQKISNQHKSIFDFLELNHELLAAIEKIQDKYQLAILTASDKLPLHPEIAPKLQNLFDPILFSKKLGVSKDQPDCYRLAAEKLGVKPEEIIFVDDKSQNVEAAKAAGCKIVHFYNTKTALLEIKKITQNESALI
jgi:HAD superfamily hydrolase (TIGR01509 family)